MSAPHLHPHTVTIHGVPVTPSQLRLADGSEFIVTTNVPGTTGGKLAGISSASFYAILGRLRVPTGPAAGYLGETGALKNRPAVSYGRWATTLRLLVPVAMVLVLPPSASTNPGAARRHQNPRFRRLVEGRMVRDLNAGITMLNTQSAPIESNRRLPRADRLAALALADEITANITEYALGHTANPHPFPATTNKEQAIRVIRASNRALDTDDVVQLTGQAGNPVPGFSPDFTMRRDLNDREQVAGGTPRIFTCLITTDNGSVRRLYYGPHLTKHQAIASY
ncbi:hypothetical protein SAMN05660690_4100 [Geodermatophilus telluris]|uniref:Uncharacterized protein n=1 Tax=Geodermatophilus telluris TaxID=1190417 RepID=A0A1G6U9F9_9ACTN|nr:hypothetical protein [Geodermatophilus telluris]SDD37336.1 hypothetical protein SAMN05660690_4100 [Geodermatophilus telluris]